MVAEPVSDKQAKIAIALFVAAVVFILLVAFFGYINGAWVVD